MTKSNIRQDYDHVMNTEQGRRVIADLVSFCKVDGKINVPGDPYTTHVNIGLYNVLQHIEGMLSKNAGSLFDLKKEADLVRIKSHIGAK